MILFDAMLTQAKGSEVEGCISKMEGELLSYIDCSNGHRKEIMERYLQLGLDLMGNQAGTVQSLHEAIMLTKCVDNLNGDNKFYCQSCGMKVDSKKGMGYKSFPPILTFVIKRTAFDFTTYKRLKKTDKVSFPAVIDMNKYLDSYNWQIGEKYINDFNFFDQEKKNNFIQNALSNGPYVYELYSIIVHDGGIEEGSYFSYIKDPKDNEWNKFFDTNVSHISESLIKESFGKEIEGVDNGIGTTAIMLFYKRYDPEYTYTEPIIPI